MSERSFQDRHIGPDDSEIKSLLENLDLRSLDDLMAKVVPPQIHSQRQMKLPEPLSEAGLMEQLGRLADKNQVVRSLIGLGYSGTSVPPVIQRTVLENPGWYTQYTPYQSEIAQGRLEALLNFQTMVSDLTGLPLSNASLLDEGTAAAEAMAMSFSVNSKNGNSFFVSNTCHPQTIEVLKTRAEPLGIRLLVEDPNTFDFSQPVFGGIFQYPNTFGIFEDYSKAIEKLHQQKALATFATDLLALTLFKSPGEWGADIAVGNSQRFGVPLGFGGPHAAFLSTRDEFKRKIPGRLVGVSKDADGKPAYRLTLQTREQHIRRDQATSNICTAQVLLAIMSSMYAVYHGPKGLRAIAERVHGYASALGEALKVKGAYFDTVTFETDDAKSVMKKAGDAGFNLRQIDSRRIGIALDELTAQDELSRLAKVLGLTLKSPKPQVAFPRTSEYLTHPVFQTHHSETEMLRYIKRLESKDLSLTTSMIPLGSCTMKLNAAAQLYPISWKEFAHIHPMAPHAQTQGYAQLISELESMLSEVTGFDATSLQPNAGSQGEYAGLLAIRGYLRQKGQEHRNICLIPTSAHGTNPASAVMAGMKVLGVKCDSHGNIDVGDLKQKAEQHKDDLAALMITYPSTHGVFEESVKEICDIVHTNGGQVYLDGANMNAQIGHCFPGEYGADVCHLNLHKTFAIPHGGGGPGVGPICVLEHLKPFLPGHLEFEKPGAIASAPWGSAGVLPISWSYLRLLGEEGLKRSTEVAILNANYIARRLDSHFPVLYKGKGGWVAHECIVDLRPLKATAKVEVEDVAKRLMDYGFHAPTISWPVAGTMMIEPTESESKAELDRFCDAMISIREEIREIEQGKADPKNNLLKNAPHPAAIVSSDQWDRPYSREKAAYPAEILREHKFWPPVSRVDNVYGDRNVFCTCPPVA